MKSLSLTLLFSAVVGLLVFLLLPAQFRQPLEERLMISSFFRNEKGLASLKAGDASQAAQYFLEALAEVPNQILLKYNLGVAFQTQKKMEEADKVYSRLTEDPEVDPRMKFNAEFNRGTIQHEAKAVDKAIAFYQAALDLGVSEIEPKTNIELLIQQQKGGGGGDSKEKDPKDQQDKSGEGKDDKDKKEDPKQYAKNPPPQKKPFKSDKLDQSDVKKILDEMKSQEQKIRAEFNKKDSKPSPKEKDW